MNVTILVDYRGRFGSKRKENSFRAGFDLRILQRFFGEQGIDIKYMEFSKIDFREKWQDKIVIYSSAEDSKGLYKSYIEDVIYGLDLLGACVIPHYKYLKAHNNKVSMEILRDIIFPEDRIKSITLGNREELLNLGNNFRFPVVIKSYEGAVSRNVRMCYNLKLLEKCSKKLMLSPDMVYNLKELYRSWKRSPYRPESKFRKKAIVQNMIEGLCNDWKILVFGNKYYKLKRLNREGDPRASGSGRFVFDREIDYDILNFAKHCFETFNVPVASLDIAKDEQGCVLIEFQFVTFGTKTLEDSDHYYRDNNGIWEIVDEEPLLEREFATSYAEYIFKNFISKELVHSDRRSK